MSRRTSLLAAPVAISLLMLSLPVRNTLHLGQTSIIPVLLVLLGCFAARGERACRRPHRPRRRPPAHRAALRAAAVVHRPPPRRRCRRDHLRRLHRARLGRDAARLVDLLGAPPRRAPGSASAADDLANQSLHGALLRFGARRARSRSALFVALGARVAVLGLRRAVRYAQDGQLLLAVAITGCVAVAVSPTTWQHQLLWVLLARRRPGRQARLRPATCGRSPSSS